MKRKGIWKWRRILFWIGLACILYGTNSSADSYCREAIPKGILCLLFLGEELCALGDFPHLLPPKAPIIQGRGRGVWTQEPNHPKPICWASRALQRVSCDWTIDSQLIGEQWFYSLLVSDIPFIFIFAVSQGLGWGHNILFIIVLTTLGLVNSSCWVLSWKTSQMIATIV